MKRLIKKLSNFHRPAKKPDVFLFASPRGGSTWFMEMIWSQAGFKYCSEPFNVRVPEIRNALGLRSFADLYSEEFEDKCLRYIHAIRQNRCGFLNPNPFRKNHRFITDRMVFKVIHAGIDRIGWFEDQFDAKILHVIRHPIPVSLSREVFPLLDEFGSCDLRQHFSDDQCRLADRIAKGGSHLERGVVAWCLHNAIPLRERKDSWAAVSYEQAVLEPEKVIGHLCEKLELTDPNCMLEQSEKASAVLKKSSVENQKLLTDTGERKRLVSAWRAKVDQDLERELMAILDEFELSTYTFQSDRPCSEMWL